MEEEHGARHRRVLPLIAVRRLRIVVLVIRVHGFNRRALEGFRGHALEVGVGVSTHDTGLQCDDIDGRGRIGLLHVPGVLRVLDLLRIRGQLPIDTLRVRKIQDNQAIGPLRPPP